MLFIGLFLGGSGGLYDTAFWIIRFDKLCTLASSLSMAVDEVATSGRPLGLLFTLDGLEYISLLCKYLFGGGTYGGGSNSDDFRGVSGGDGESVSDRIQEP